MHAIKDILHNLPIIYKITTRRQLQTYLNKIKGPSL